MRGGGGGGRAKRTAPHTTNTWGGTAQQHTREPRKQPHPGVFVVCANINNLLMDCANINNLFAQIDCLRSAKLYQTIQPE